MKTKGILFFLILTATLAEAQQANQFHSWWIFQGNYRLHERITINPIYGWSRNQFVKHWQQSLLGSSVNYRLNNQLSTGAGYEWIERFPYGEQPLPHRITIHRFYQHVRLKHRIGKVGVAHLLRWNQEIQGEQVSYFIINQIGLKIPIVQENEVAKLSLKLSEGIFINHGRWAKASLFGQSRTFGGFNFFLNKHLNLDLGYLNHYIVKQSGLIENNHTLIVRVVHGV